MIVRWTDGAAAQLEAIHDHIAEHDPAAAARAAANIVRVVDLLAEQPMMGRVYRPPDVRILPISGLPYLVLYRVVGDAVQVIRVFHGAQDRIR